MASGTFGITATGFLRPTFLELLQQEQDAMRAGMPSLTFAAGSPELAITEARAKVRDDEWATQECAFNSFDINNQTGCALDIAANLQGFQREGESDDDFKARINATVTGTSFVNTLESEISLIDGVCRVRVFNNTSTGDDAYTGNPAGSYEVVYQGGSFNDVALATWNCSTGAINVGTQTVTLPDDDGVCRDVRITEVTEVPYCVRLTVDTYASQNRCDNQTFESIQAATLEALTSKSINIGDPIHAGTISGTVYSQVSGLDIQSIEFAPSSVDVNGDCTCDDVLESDWQSTALLLDHRSIPTFDADCIVIISRDR